MTINVGVGMSNLSDSYESGKDAATKAINEMKSEKANVLIVLAAPRFEHQKLLDGITSITKDTPLIGGTTAGEISTFGLSTSSVVVMAISSDKVKFSVGLGQNLSSDEGKAGIQVVEDALKNMPKEDAKTLIILPDGLAGDGLKVVEGAQSLLGKDFEIIGGALGDEGDFKKTYQYFNGKVYENSVPGLLIGGELITGTGVCSGWMSIGGRLTCTEVKGNLVYKFGDKSALDVYKEYLGEERSKRLPAVALEYPFGLIDEKANVQGKEYFQLRAPMSVNEQNGSISLAARIPEGAKITMTSATREDVINASKTAALQAKESLGEKTNLKLILMFSCIARKIVLGRRISEEISSVQSILGKDIPMIGFYTYGEIGPIDKVTPALKPTKFHNQTVVILSVGEKE